MKGANLKTTDIVLNKYSFLSKTRRQPCRVIKKLLGHMQSFRSLQIPNELFPLSNTYIDSFAIV